MVEQTSPKEFDPEISQAADELIALHGDEVENATTEKMIQVLDESGMDEVLYWLRVRQCVRQKIGNDRYVRRLSDKMLWAVEQALEQGRGQLARVLGGVYSEAKANDERDDGDRRK